MKVYFVATLKLDEKGFIERHRVPGYFDNLEDASNCIKENWGDIYEDGYYPYAVIEAVENGLYMAPLESIWYKWEGDFKTGGYKLINKPEKLKHVIGFTIG